MNSCYTQVSDQVGINLQEGWSIAPLFREAGMALVDCYNEVIKGMAQQYSTAGQSYQSALYNHLVNENNHLIQLISQLGKSSKPAEMAKPPMKIAPQKKKKKK